MRTITFKGLFLTVLFVLLGSLAIQAADDGWITEKKQSSWIRQVLYLIALVKARSI